jgi:sugar phosphate isomerase/epimerase
VKEPSTERFFLDKSYRGRFPFRIATTSFILPDRIAPNVRALAPYVDEVEVLLFEKNAPPTEDEIREVSGILEETALTVNVHLPLDAALAGNDRAKRVADARLLRRRIEQTQPWRPTSYCLHIAPAPPAAGSAALRRWRDRAAEALSLVLAGPASPEKFTVETLDYPFAGVEPLVERFGLSVCVDLGHLFVRGFDPLPIFARHESRISVIHLHGVAGGRDHLSLSRMEPAFVDVTRTLLAEYTGVVSIEVFSAAALTGSLPFLETIAPFATDRGKGPVPPAVAAS